MAWIYTSLGGSVALHLCHIANFIVDVGNYRFGLESQEPNGAAYRIEDPLDIGLFG